jgi:heme/flavin dehydrogenase (mycofactocin system)
VASSRDWFESVAEAQRRAKRRLPSSVYSAVIAGAEQGVTVEDNVRAFRELAFIPRIATGCRATDLSTTVLGQELALPVAISPTGVQAVHPDGEVAVARAAAAAGTAMSVGAFASKPVEEVLAANPNTFFQTYWMGTSERMVQTMERARTAGAKGLIATLDWTFCHRRDRGSPAIPERLDAPTMLRFAPQAALHPSWLLSFLRGRRLPDLTVPNLAPPGGEAPAFFGAYGEWMSTPPPTWQDIAWMREQWGGPFLVKGVMHPDDARQAVAIGADAISVSNHGGNNLDGTPASIRALPAVVDAVGGEVEVLLDGGIRRGSDVVKALALGARAVLIGRAYLWGLAAGGETGVRNVLDILRAGIEETLAGVGRTSIHELVPEDVVVPQDFARAPTAPASALRESVA